MKIKLFRVKHKLVGYDIIFPVYPDNKIPAKSLPKKTSNYIFYLYAIVGRKPGEYYKQGITVNVKDKVHIIKEKVNKGVLEFQKNLMKKAPNTRSFNVDPLIFDKVAKALENV